MAAHVVLLRAVNVGGTGKLAMADLKAMAADAGFEAPQTYIASGNLVLESDQSATAVKDALATRLEAHAGKPVGIIVTSLGNLEAIEAGNPFPGAPGNRVIVLFFAGALPDDALGGLKHQSDEEVAAGDAALYVHYPSGQGQSKLVIPAARTGTGRNMNTVRKLIDMAAARGA